MGKVTQIKGTSAIDGNATAESGDAESARDAVKILEEYDKKLEAIDTRQAIRFHAEQVKKHGGTFNALGGSLHHLHNAAEMLYVPVPDVERMKGAAKEAAKAAKLLTLALDMLGLGAYSIVRLPNKGTPLGLED